MDFHALPRRDLQALCKRNGVRANMTNVAMADALGALPAVHGMEEYVKEPVAEPAPAAKSGVKTVVEEEKQGNPLPRGRRATFKSSEPITREDGENKENAPALGVGRRGASRRARVEPVVAPVTRRSAAARKTEAGDVAAEAVPAPAPATTRWPVASKTEAGDVAAETMPAPATRRPRSQRTVDLVVEEEVPRARRTTRKTAARHEEEGEGPQGVASDVETTAPALVSDEGCDDPEGIEEDMNPRNAEEIEVVQDSIQEDEGAVMDSTTPVAEDCTVDSSVQEQQVDVLQCEDSPTFMGLVEQEGELHEEIHHSSEETGMVPVNEAPQATLNSSEATEEVGFTGDAGRAIEEDNEVPTTSIEVLHSAAKANDAGTEDCFLSEEKEDLAVDVMLHDTVVAFEEEGVVVTDEMPHSSETMDGGVEEVVTADGVSQVTVTDKEGAGKEIALAGDVPPVADTAKDCSDHITSPLFDGMLDDATISLSMDSIAVEPTVSEADDVPLCIYNNSGGEKNVTEPVAMEQEKEVKEGNNSEALGKLSLRKLRVKLKETVAVEQENVVKEGKKSMALDKLSLRKLRIKLKETLIAHKSREPNRVALGRLDENVC